MLKEGERRSRAAKVSKMALGAALVGRRNGFKKKEGWQ
jgi:hypothetical protein